MNKYTFTDDHGNTWTRINKKAAEKAFVNGKTVVAIPHNLRPFTPWHCEFYWNRSQYEQFVADEIGMKNYFSNLCNSCEFYNCNAETGKYLAFYVC